MYTDANSLINQKRMELIIGWEGMEKMIKQWPVLLNILMGLQEKHPDIYELAIIIESM